MAGQPQREPLHSGARPHPIRVEAGPGSLRYRQDPPHGNHPMKGRAFFLACAAALAYRALSAPADQPGHGRVYVTSAASSLVEQGLAAPAPTGAEAGAFQQVPAPAVRMQANEAQATTAPWIESNGWRFERGISKANYSKLPAGFSSLAAAAAVIYALYLLDGG